jgi:hypothetical protein
VLAAAYPADPPPMTTTSKSIVYQISGISKNIAGFAMSLHFEIKEEAIAN